VKKQKRRTPTKIIKFPDLRKPHLSFRERVTQNIWLKILVRFILLLVVIYLIVIMVGCGEEVSGCGKDEFPAKFYVHSDFPQERIQYIKEAMEEWNRALGVEVFKYDGRSDTPYDTDDYINTIHWLGDELDEKAAGDACWWKGCGAKIRCDIRVKKYEFGVPLTNEDGSRTYYVDKGNDYLRALMMHELGHCMNLQHTENKFDIMYGKGIYNPSGEYELSIFDIERAKSELGLGETIYYEDGKPNRTPNAIKMILE